MVATVARRPVEQHFVVKWTVACGVGWAIGLPIFVPSLMADNVVVRFAGPALAGAIVGASQWALLRARMSQGVAWILVTAASAAIAGTLGFGMLLAMVFFPPIGFFFGALVGLAQWLVVRRQFSGAGWWILWSTMGVGVGWLAGLGAFLMGVGGEGILMSLTGLVAGAGGGLMTGRPLSNLLQRSRVATT